MLRTLILTTAIALPLALPTTGFAAGGGSDAKPKKTETTQNCLQARQWDPETKKYVRFSEPVNGVWDADIKKCVRPDKTSHLDSDTLYKAVRELAYAGRYNEAIQVLDQMPEQLDDRVLTYRGFTARKLGNLEQANLYYEQALTVNPDNILARSYMGQGKLAAGDKVAAMTQLREIQERGGAGTWAEASLRDAIQTGSTYNY
ncbi:tetratricopeptide repeat protein [uncultured Tateyamaria sp.]|uniref:tetratricopeptide repeat protein n=1 Tax=uncultured Tateyamaria sp. TaxID=455651 RepID=UPI00261E80AD|nr:tetratricopeptide repeat protein [uncultured Tateyamaria sp.]